MKFSDSGTLSADDIQARIGKLTASRMGDAMAFRKDGKPASERVKYMHEVVAERMTDVLVPHYVNDAMQWGIDNEGAAKETYQLRTGRKIRPAAYIDHPSIEYCGATPDGYVDDGLIEIKCPTTTTYLAWLLSGVVPDQHMPQMGLQMLCTGKRWCDFVAFDPRMPEGRTMFVRRFTPTDEFLASIEAAAKQFLREVDAMFEAITTASY